MHRLRDMRAPDLICRGRRAASVSRANGFRWRSPVNAAREADAASCDCNGLRIASVWRGAGIPTRCRGSHTLVARSWRAAALAACGQARASGETMPCERRAFVVEGLHNQAMERMAFGPRSSLR